MNKNVLWILLFVWSIAFVIVYLFIQAVNSFANKQTNKVKEFEAKENVIVYEVYEADCEDLKLDWGETKQLGKQCVVYGPNYDF